MRKDLDYLFVSKVRISILKLFFTKQDVPYHVRGVVREIREEINAVRRELIRLSEIKLLTSQVKGNRVYYSLNSSFTLYNELLSMIYKSFGLGAEIIRSEKQMGNIKYAFLSKVFTRGIKLNETDPDLVVIGDVSLEEVDKVVKKMERELEREVNYIVMKPMDFELRKKRKDPYITSLLMGSMVMLIGDQDEMIVL